MNILWILIISPSKVTLFQEKHKFERRAKFNVMNALVVDSNDNRRQSLRRLENFLLLRIKITLDQSILLSLRDYGDIANLDLSEGLLDKLDRLQNLCIRYASFRICLFDTLLDSENTTTCLISGVSKEKLIICLLFNSLFNSSASIYLSERFSYLAAGSQYRLR